MKPIELKIKCVFDPDDGTFGGILFGKDGTKIGPVTGDITLSLLSTKREKKIGRPKETWRAVAVYAHTSMALNVNNSSVGNAQILVANALSIGSREHPDDQKRAVQRHCSKAREALPAKGMELFYWAPPGTEISSALWVFFETGADIESSEQMPDGTSTLALRGPGWICNWNDRKARCGTISLKMDGQSDEHIRRATEILST